MELLKQLRITSSDGVLTPLSVFSMFDHYRASSYVEAIQYSNGCQIHDSAIVSLTATGVKVSHEVIKLLYHPNKSDSFVAFKPKIAVSTLSHKTYIFGMGANPHGGVACPAVILYGAGRDVDDVLSFLRVERVGNKTTQARYTDAHLKTAPVLPQCAIQDDRARWLCPAHAGDAR